MYVWLERSNLDEDDLRFFLADLGLSGNDQWWLTRLHVLLDWQIVISFRYSAYTWNRCLIPVILSSQAKKHDSKQCALITSLTDKSSLWWASDRMQQKRLRVVWMNIPVATVICLAQSRCTFKLEEQTAHTFDRHSISGQWPTLHALYESKRDTTQRPRRPCIDLYKSNWKACWQFNCVFLDYLVKCRHFTKNARTLFVGLWA